MLVAPAAVLPALTVPAVERALLTVDGMFHVAGIYYANPSDAERARRREAERQVRAGERRRLWLDAHPCAFCGERVGPTESFDLVAGEPVHTDGCMSQLDAMLYPTAPAVEAR